jgi:cytochrome c biogenesis protein CcdA/thiol-disulfide isomerase/thioredoxin
MLLLVLFAFLAGVVTIASPCVLPVLPMLLSTSSVGGGRTRPLGIVLGLAITFTAVTLAVAAAADALTVPASWLRIAAIVMLGIFGLSLLLPSWRRASERLLSPFARLTSTGTPRSGFGGGLLVGAGLGLIWAPCVGPIMASVISLSAVSGLSGAGIAITLAYAFGAGVPMLLIAYGTRGLATKAKRVGPASELAQRAFGALTVLTCVALLLGLDARLQTYALQSLPTGWSSALLSIEQQPSVQKEITMLDNKPSMPAATQPTQMPMMQQPTQAPIPQPTPKPAIALEDLGPAPELTGITGWINSEPLTLSDLRGKVVIVDFWTFACYNCQNTMPYVRALYDKYYDQGLEIIGVHTPEFAFEHIPDNISKAAKEQGVIWPIAMDPDYKTWRAYNNHYWPAFYFIDANGHIRYTHFGEGNYDYHDKVVQQLLSEAKPAARKVSSLPLDNKERPMGVPCCFCRVLQRDGIITVSGRGAINRAPTQLTCKT